MTGIKNTEETLEKDWHFASDEEISFGIETAIYKNGNIAKRFLLSNGKQVIVRELFGRDMMKIDKLLAGENNNEAREEKFFYWGFHFAVKIDNEQVPMEDFEKLKAKDYTKVKLAYQSLNF